MNKQILALLEQSDLILCIDDAYRERNDWQPLVEEFAKLIVHECSTVLRNEFDAHFKAKFIEDHFGINDEQI